jgi:hypothetical protein
MCHINKMSRCGIRGGQIKGGQIKGGQIKGGQIMGGQIMGGQTAHSDLGLKGGKIVPSGGFKSGFRGGIKGGQTDLEGGLNLNPFSWFKKKRSRKSRSRSPRRR